MFDHYVTFFFKLFLPFYFLTIPFFEKEYPFLHTVGFFRKYSTKLILMVKIAKKLDYIQQTGEFQAYREISQERDLTILIKLVLVQVDYKF